MADLHRRMVTALMSIAAATSVGRIRADDAARAARNGDASQLEAVVVRLEAAAAELWTALGEQDGNRLTEVA